ncbi:MAG: hypothetical protein IJD87_04220 [Turicibacter sp.]|nr:hypothetical protein [Turicibacter sp.]
MKDPNIKSVIQSQLDSIEMDRHLKYKTLKYIEDKSTKVHRPKWKLIGGSLGAFAVCMIGLIMTQLPQSISRPESVAMLSEEGNIQTRQSTLPLEDVTNHLEQLKLDYHLGVTESNDDYILTPIHIDDKVSYYLELSTPVDNSILCLNEEFTIIQLEDNHLFFYTGENDELKQLLLDIGTLMCK